jgi:hypothetical protein
MLSTPSSQTVWNCPSTPHRAPLLIGRHHQRSLPKQRSHHQAPNFLGPPHPPLYDDRDLRVLGIHPVLITPVLLSRLGECVHRRHRGWQDLVLLRLRHTKNCSRDQRIEQNFRH